jgi:hypothetical protein
MISTFTTPALRDESSPVPIRPPRGAHPARALTRESMIRAWLAVAIALGAALVTACEPTAPVRDCPGCTYDFTDTVPPDILVFHWPATPAQPVRFYADPRGTMPALVSLAVEAWGAQFLYGEFRG